MSAYEVCNCGSVALPTGRCGEKHKSRQADTGGLVPSGTAIGAMPVRGIRASGGPNRFVARPRMRLPNHEHLPFEWGLAPPRDPNARLPAANPATNS